MTSAPALDGRSTRWEAHRTARREELVQAALRAITRHGPGVGVDEIAAEAGTSKTALYRHFADKEQLYLAVAERVSRRVLADLGAAAASHERPRAALGAVIATYLRLVADDPDVYWFVTHRPAGSGGPGSADPLAGLSSAVSAELAAAITQRLTEAGIDASAAPAWAHGLVGMIRAATDHWMARRASDPSGSPPAAPPAVPSADELAAQLTALAWGGLSRAPLSHDESHDHEERP